MGWIKRSTLQVSPFENLLAQPPDLEYSPFMANGAPTSALERLLRPLSRELTADLARAIVNLKADAETQARYDELANKRSAEELTADEQGELESIVGANTLLGVLKAEARAFLANGNPR